MKAKEISVTSSRAQNAFGLRIPAELKALLKEKADKNGRSLNSEILIRLRDSLVNE